MDKTVTWFGPFEGSGAYPTINRQLSGTLERRGWRVLRNQHNEGQAVTPVAVAHVYPPRAINLRHDLTIALTAWEFAGPLGVPRSFITPLQSYDVVCAPAQWTADILAGALGRPVQVVPWGYDPDEFSPQGKVYPLKGIMGRRVLWAGGTDARHGFDVALAVVDQLPDGYHLIAKQSVHYPPDAAAHPRLTVIRDDLPSMAPLYRACDGFLHSARGVGFALHCLEALACGLPVASTPLLPVTEYGADRTIFADAGTWQHFDHHLHTDCVPIWWEPDPAALAKAVVDAVQMGKLVALPAEFTEQWTWDTRAERLEQVIQEAWRETSMVRVSISGDHGDAGDHPVRSYRWDVGNGSVCTGNWGADRVRLSGDAVALDGGGARDAAASGHDESVDGDLQGDTA